MRLFAVGLFVIGCGTEPAPLTPASPTALRAVGSDDTTAPVAPPTPVAPDPPPPAPEPPPTPPPPAHTRADDFDIATQSLGPLHLGMSDADAVKILKRPKTKPPRAELMGATGEYVSFWDFGQALLQMAGADPKGPFRVSSIEITRPSKFKTPAGIGIGSTRAEVIAAYQEFLGHTDEPDAILVGSVYGGMLVRLQRDKVVSIFIGAMAF